MILFRSALFNAFFFAVTFLMTVGLATPVRLLAPHCVMDVARLWARIVLWGLYVICGIRLQVTGLRHIGTGAALIASRHQSAFDTFVWLTLVPRCCYVLKRELLHIPLFGPLLGTPGIPEASRRYPYSDTSTTFRGVAARPAHAVPAYCAWGKPCGLTSLQAPVVSKETRTTY